MKIRTDCKQSARISGTTPSGCARRAPIEKKTYTSRVLGGKDLAQRPISEASDISGKTTQPAQEMGRKLVLGSRRRRSSRVGSRLDRGNVGSSKVRLAE